MMPQDVKGFVRYGITLGEFALYIFCVILSNNPADTLKGVGSLYEASYTAKKFMKLFF